MTFDNFNRITQYPGIIGGRPCIRGMRLTVNAAPPSAGFYALTFSAPCPQKFLSLLLWVQEFHRAGWPNRPVNP